LFLRNTAKMENVLDKIRDFADHAHGTQMRKYTPERYIVHPVRVMETCRDYDSRLPVLAAALLHDVLEDTVVGREEMFDFLLSVMSAIDAQQTLEHVEELTDVYVKEDYPQWNRKRRKEKELERITNTSATSQTIKYADILDNTKEIVVQDRVFAPRYLRECHKILEQADKGNKELRAKALDIVESNLRQI
jgi:(p)ppGpp synthase/HD superfamily hydrolase